MKGKIYISKDYSSKIFELMGKDDDEAIQKLIDQNRASEYPATDFSYELKEDITKDLQILKKIQDLWSSVKRDPKLLSFTELLSTHPVLKKNKLIVFTESQETADYLAKRLGKEFPGEVIAFTGASSVSIREKVIENFDARAHSPKDKYRILIATEVLSEGVNLHRSNVVINYDIPWNPTRLMQRVGRINRVDTKFEKIYSFNFFPTEQSNDQIKLKEAAEAKIQAFITLLGADARLLTEGEALESHELFNRLTSKEMMTGEDEEEISELKYLQAIRDVRDQTPDLFEKVKRLPKKARTARKQAHKENQLLTYFRQGKLQKFFLVGKGEAKEIDFMRAAGRLEADTNAPRENLPPDFYDKLARNKRAFAEATTETADTEENVAFRTRRGGRDRAMDVIKILKILQDLRQYTEEQEAYFKRVVRRLEEGALPKQTTNTVYKALQKEFKSGKPSPLKVLALLQNNIPDELLKSHLAEGAAQAIGSREVVLSNYMVEE